MHRKYMYCFIEGYQCYDSKNRRISQLSLTVLQSHYNYCIIAITIVLIIIIIIRRAL